jgi:hypothetical protein
MSLLGGLIILALAAATFLQAARLTPERVRRMRIGLGAFDFVGYLPVWAARTVCVLVGVAGVVVGLAFAFGRIH